MPEDLDRVKKLIKDVLITSGVDSIDESVSVHRGAGHVKLTVDRENGIPLDECAKINKLIDKRLNAEGMFDQKFTIEVSSPGLDRPLKGREEFKRCRGKLVRVITRIPQGKSNVFTGTIKAVEGREIVFQNANNEVFHIDIDNIKKANLEVRW